MHTVRLSPGAGKEGSLSLRDLCQNFIWLWLRAKIWKKHVNRIALQNGGALPNTYILYNIPLHLPFPCCIHSQHSFSNLFIASYVHLWFASMNVCAQHACLEVVEARRHMVL